VFGPSSEHGQPRLVNKSVTNSGFRQRSSIDATIGPISLIKSTREIKIISMRGIVDLKKSHDGPGFSKVDRALSEQ
jgi:hypothetical protein